MSIFIIIFFIILIFLFKNSFKLDRKKDKQEDFAKILGKIGEARVNLVLERLSKEYSIFNDIYLSINDKTVQIDHLIISIYGIFIIETKNYSGWIYGKEDSDYWIENKFGKKYKFYNPLKQNYFHKKSLSTLLKIYEEKIISIVVFSGEAELKSKIKGNIIYLDELEDFIFKYNKPILSEGYVEKIKYNLLKNIINNKEIEELHIKNIRRNLIEKNRRINKGICPKCGGRLVERKSNYGKFIGCSNYPKCKFILKN